MFSGKNEYGLYVANGVDDDLLFDAVDEVIGEDSYAPFPGKFMPGFKWGLFLQGWERADVEKFARQLHSRLKVQVVPDWVLETA